MSDAPALIPCPECGRHIWAGELCPFCTGQVAEKAAAPAAPADAPVGARATAPAPHPDVPVAQPAYGGPGVVGRRRSRKGLIIAGAVAVAVAGAAAWVAVNTAMYGGPPLPEPGVQPPEKTGESP